MILRMLFADDYNFFIMIGTFTLMLKGSQQTSTIPFAWWRVCQATVNADYGWIKWKRMTLTFVHVRGFCVNFRTIWIRDSCYESWLKHVRRFFNIGRSSSPAANCQIGSDELVLVIIWKTDKEVVDWKCQLQNCKIVSHCLWIVVRVRNNIRHFEGGIPFWNRVVLNHLHNCRLFNTMCRSEHIVGGNQGPSAWDLEGFINMRNDSQSEFKMDWILRNHKPFYYSVGWRLWYWTWKMTTKKI